MPPKEIKECYAKFRDDDRDFDLEFWQSVEPKERMRATWELITHAYRVKGIDVSKLRLDRSVARFRRLKVRQ